MDGTITVLVAASAFVGTHLILSHPLRAPLVKALGETGFALLYMLVAFGTLGWAASAYRAAPDTMPLWMVGEGIWAVASMVMLIASVLLMGSLVRNPALPGKPGAAPAIPDQARGVFAITRHPMMWSIALWGVAHILVHPVAANLALATAIALLALIGSALQDRKKAALHPDSWPTWQARTSYWPFAAILAGRARFGGFGMHALAGGVVVWLAATWAHMPLAGQPAGIWRWIG